jgi:hypothetical protein
MIPDRLVFDNVLSGDEDEPFDRAWKDEYGDDGSKAGSIYRFAFLAHHYAGEKRLEKLGQLALFRKTQGLPDYAKAEKAVKRGWGKFMEQQYGIIASEATDKLKFRQYQLLYQLRGSKTREDRRNALRPFAEICEVSARRADDVFFRKLGNALTDAARTKENTNDLAEVLLSNWLTGFWWLMPLKAAANDLARLQGIGDDPSSIKKLYQCIRQITTRGWNDCFYSHSTLLIDCIERGGIPLLNAAGRRLIRV